MGWDLLNTYLADAFTSNRTRTLIEHLVLQYNILLLELIGFTFEDKLH